MTNRVIIQDTVKTGLKPVMIQEQDFYMVGSCPTTGTQVLKTEQQTIAVSDEMVNWWHCSICNGWHIELNAD